MNPPDPRALCAAEKRIDTIFAQFDPRTEQLTMKHHLYQLVHDLQARHAAGPPESPAPPASSPPEGDIKKIASIWVEQNWKYLLWNDISPRLERKYTDCCRHEFVPIEKLAEAKQQGRAEALDDVLAAAERIYQEEMESDPSDYFFTKQAVNECRP